MKTKAPQRNQRFDVFISHASKDARFARQLVPTLEHEGLKAWIDDADVRFGTLLRDGLQSAIRECRVLILVWSKAASESRWVMAEMFTALHSERFIIPCMLDRTPLPQFLQNTAWLDRQRDRAKLGEKPCAAIRGAPCSGNKVAPFAGGANREVDEAVKSLMNAQAAELDSLLKDRTKAAELHEKVDSALRVVEKAFPFEPMIVSLVGYHRKKCLPRQTLGCDKLRRQIEAASPAARRLMAEMLWMLLLFQTRMRPATKQDNNPAEVSRGAW